MPLAISTNIAAENDYYLGYNADKVQGVHQSA